LVINIDGLADKYFAVLFLRADHPVAQLSGSKSIMKRVWPLKQAQEYLPESSWRTFPGCRWKMKNVSETP
jgi:hypothetical protein